MRGWKRSAAPLELTCRQAAEPRSATQPYLHSGQPNPYSGGQPYL